MNPGFTYRTPASALQPRCSFMQYGARHAVTFMLFQAFSEHASCDVYRDLPPSHFFSPFPACPAPLLRYCPLCVIPECTLRLNTCGNYLHGAILHLFLLFLPVQVASALHKTTSGEPRDLAQVPSSRSVPRWRFIAGDLTRILI